MCFSFQNSKAQYTEAKVFAYNALVGSISGGIGALINKKKDQKWHKVLLKGFVVGFGGGAICYSGKKLNSLIAIKKELGYAYLSRAVFSVGNSIVENAASNRPFWSRWHYDIGFVRLELQTNGPLKFTPKVMPSSLGGIVFMAVRGRLDENVSLRSGTFTFRADRVIYASHLVASTASNGFLFVNALNSGQVFYDTYAHEMVHAFQFQEFSGCNYFFNPLTDKWKEKSPLFKKTSKWIYGDVNFELMLFNYFIINQGNDDSKAHYCKNYLENEAEFLSVGRSACFEQ
ncbi:MAG: hypothetical protein V4677_06035 [Bacteroidota bacterium]